MTREMDAAREVITRVRQARRLDGRMVREQLGKGKKATWRISCVGCGTVLVVGQQLEKAEALAQLNATARPCCKVWVSDAMQSTYWLDRGNEGA